MREKIDFVVPWVDDSDPAWQAEKARYSVNKSHDARNIRYRDCGWLRYWFRGVEKYAPWVNRVHFITCGHFPKWLNLDCPKLNFVKHSDYMPKKYLPTFSSHPIELNMHRIKGLSEKFVYFNDDFFLINPVKKKDFFVNGKPCDCLVGSAITPRNGEFSSILCANVGTINDHFEKKDLISLGLSKNFNLKYKELLIRTLTVLPYTHIMGFYNPHICQSFCKSTFSKLWKLEYDILDRTSRNRFRGLNDVSQYLMRYWNLCEGNFYPQYPIGKQVNINIGGAEIAKLITDSEHKVLCINDSAIDLNFDKEQKIITKAFERKFPEKSCFELP